MLLRYRNGSDASLAGAVVQFQQDAMTTIKTTRLLLRKPIETDLDALHEIMADAQTMRFWSTLPHEDREVTRRFLASMIAEMPETSDDFIIEHKGRLIGKLGMWRLPEIGFILSRHCWGQGYATEALCAFIKYRFAKGTDHLTAEADPRNAASLALLLQAGFKETGRAARTWLIGEEWSDSVYLRLDRP